MRMHTAFSSDKDKVLELSLEYDRFVSIDSSLVRLINGNALTGLDENGDVNSDMLDGVIFIPANKYVIFAKEGFVYSRKAATVPVRCVSVSDIEKYVDFEIIVDTLPVIVNYYSKPEYDAEKDGIVFGTQIVNFDFTEGAAIDIYAAAYDENGVLLGATLTKPVFDSKGIVYMRGITFDGLKEDGEYTLKLFVFGSDGKLTPIARSYSVNYSKE